MGPRRRRRVAGSLSLALGAALAGVALFVCGCGSPTTQPSPPAHLVSPRATPPPSGGHVVNVRDFGAAGNGATDDYAAIQAAIDACGTTGGTIVFPRGTYLLDSRNAGGLKLPPGNTHQLVLWGYGALIRLTPNVPRFLDFDRTADHQTFAHFSVRGFSIDAAHVAGVDHVVGFTAIDGTAMSRINVDDIIVRDIHAYNILTDTSPHQQSVRVGVSISVSQTSPNESTRNTIRNIAIENVRLEGGTHGFTVAGIDYGIEGTWPKKPGEVNIQIDNVSLTGCTWDSGVRTRTGWVGDGMLMGGAASCGRLFVRNCDFRGSGDNNYEVNGWHYALLTDCVSEDATFCGYYFNNLGWPIGGASGQRIIWRRCVHRQNADTGSSNGWVVGTPATVRPLGTLILDRSTVESTVPDTGGVGFFGMTERTPVTEVDITGCSFSATGQRAVADTWPVAVNLQCGGSPGGGPSSVSIQDTTMYYRSYEVGSPQYVVRLVEITGDVTWSVTGSRFDAAVANPSGARIRLLGLGDTAPTTGGGLVGQCVFKSGTPGTVGVAMGDASTLQPDRPVVVKGCDFRGLGPNSTAISLPAGSPASAHATLSRNAF